MKRLLLLLCALPVFAFSANAQNQEEQSPEEMAALQAEQMAELFDFTDYQLYQADSILQVNYPAMMMEINQVQRSGAQQQDKYLMVQNKYLEIIDNAFEKIMTEEQWAKYMKSAYGQAKKKRDAAAAKAEKKARKR